MKRSWSSRIWEIIKPQRWWIVASFLLLLVNAAARLLQPWLVKSAIDDHLVSGSLEGFWWIVGGLGLTALGEWFGRRGQLLTLERAGQNALLNLRLRVFDHLQRLPVSWYDRTPTGKIVGRVTTDIESLQEMFSSGVVTVLGDLVFLITAVVILFALDVELTLASLAIVPVFVIVTMFVRKRSRAAYAAMRAKLSQMNADLHEQVSGMEVVQLFGQEERSAQRFSESNAGVRSAQLKTVHWESVLSAATEMLGSITSAVILLIGGIAALSVVGADATAGLTLGSLYAFVDYMQRMFVPLNDLSLKATVFQNAVVASERIFALLDEDVEAPDPEHPRRAEGPGSLRFENVTFGYDPDQTVLRDFSLDVNAGESIAIVGATGAGKTTILSILTRLYEVQSGTIALDGVDVREMARRDLRRQIGVVTQDVFLFRGTILDNIRLGHPDVSDEQAIAAADELGLGAVVARFPGGYREPVAERGRNLSSGEKQLISFARMLVVAPKVLALDEATSNVDAATEQLLQEAVGRVMKGRTSLVIAHRLATIREADRIIVLDRGQVVESGTHDELMAARGRYFELESKG